MVVRCFATTDDHSGPGAQCAKPSGKSHPNPLPSFAQKLRRASPLGEGIAIGSLCPLRLSVGPIPLPVVSRHRTMIPLSWGRGRGEGESFETEGQAAPLASCSAPIKHKKGDVGRTYFDCAHDIRSLVGGKPERWWEPHWQAAPPYHVTAYS
jgi:hypothetical protein